jgi:hypothetical protein
MVNLKHELGSVESGTIFLNSHYKYAIFLVLGDFKVIVDGDPNTTKLFMDVVLLIMAFVSTTYNFDIECSIWKGLN